MTSRIPAMGKMVTLIGTSAIQERYSEAMGNTPEAAVPMGLVLNIAKGPMTQRYIP